MYQSHLPRQKLRWENSASPNLWIVAVALREDLRSALQDGLRKVVLWTDQHGAETHVFDSGDIDPFFNINTPEDLELANKMMETLS